MRAQIYAALSGAIDNVDYIIYGGAKTEWLSRSLQKPQQSQLQPSPNRFIIADLDNRWGNLLLPHQTISTWSKVVE